MILDNDFSSEDVALLDIVDTGTTLPKKDHVHLLVSQQVKVMQGIPQFSQRCQYLVHNDRSRGQAGCTICAYSMGAL